jgi:parallel beta-helix repeat protein
MTKMGTSARANNITANNNHGIHIDSSFNNSVSGNNITANNGSGIILVSSSSNNIYHNNFVNNGAYGTQAFSYNSTNVWDDGYPLGGNYWSDYVGVDLYSGPYQNQTGSDGMGDAPYVIDGNNQDNYPPMKPYPWAAHDVGITSLAPSEIVVVLGSPLIINVTVFNYGNSTEYFNVTAYDNGTIISTFENVSLGSREYTTITFTWNTTGFSLGTYKISAYVAPVLGETDMADNTFIGGNVYVIKWYGCVGGLPTGMQCAKRSCPL